MLYFNKTYILDDLEKQNLEKGLRSRSLKRTKPLDFVFETYNTGSNKYFLGNDNKNDIKFTRLKTSFELLFPKIIVSFPKNKNLNYYKFRLSIVSNLVIFFLFIMLLSSFVAVVNHGNNPADLLIIAILFFGYLLLVVLELKLTRAKIKKSLAKNLD